MWCCDTVIDSLSVKGPVHLDLSVPIPQQLPDVLIVSHLCVMDGKLSKSGQPGLYATGNCVTNECGSRCGTFAVTGSPGCLNWDFAELQTNSQALNHIEINLITFNCKFLGLIMGTCK